MARYHVKRAGQGYLIRPGGYRRSTTTPYSGEDRSPGWRRWTQSGWRGGEGQLAWDGRTNPATREGDGWRAGYGVEIAGSGALGLGSALAISFASQEDGFAAMLAFRGRLYDRLGPEICGVPLAPEAHDGSGNSYQPFSRCEMWWAKFENRVWVSFRAEGW